MGPVAPWAQSLKLDPEFLNTVPGAEQGLNNRLTELRCEKHRRSELEKLNPTEWERASAPMFSEPGRCWIELVNSEMKESLSLLPSQPEWRNPNKVFLWFKVSK